MPTLTQVRTAIKRVFPEATVVEGDNGGFVVKVKAYRDSLDVHERHYIMQRVARAAPGSLRVAWERVVKGAREDVYHIALSPISGAHGTARRNPKPRNPTYAFDAYVKQSRSKVRGRIVRGIKIDDTGMVVLNVAAKPGDLLSKFRRDLDDELEAFGWRVSRAEANRRVGGRAASFRAWLVPDEQFWT